MISKEKNTQGGKTEETTLAYKFTGDKAYYAVSEPKEEKTEKNEIYFSKSNDVWSAYGLVYSGGELTFEGAYDMKGHTEYDMMTSGAIGTMTISQIAEQATFDKVTYSEEKKAYLYEEDTGTAELKIVNGLFAGYSVSATLGESEAPVSMEMSTIYYDIGTTSITLPEKMAGGSETPGENPGDPPATKETLTEDEFFAELGRREQASIAAEKWGTVDVVMESTLNGETQSWNVPGAEIVHKENGQSYAIYYKTQGSTLWVDVFMFSLYRSQIEEGIVRTYEKDGDRLIMIWSVEQENFSRLMKCTFDADGYLVKYEEDMVSEETHFVGLGTFTNYAGEYKLPEQ